MLTVWGRTNSLNVQKVLWTLGELGLEYERIDAGMQFGLTDTADYRARNPNGLVPTIDDGGLVLWESNTIVRYLAARYASGTLSPADPGERALAERWMDWQATSFYPAIVPVFMNLIRTPEEKRDHAAVEDGCRTAERWLDILDAHLAGRAFVNGDGLTIGDIPLGTAVYRWYALPVTRAAHANVERWLAGLEARPPFKAHVALPLS